MISRYNRRPVSHKLEIRGLSRNSLDHHPLPEKAHDTQIPEHYLHNLQEGVSTQNSSDMSAAFVQSGCPTVISVDSTQSWSGIHSSAGTGISTERSSIFSWRYDEFDRAASQQVQQMFDELDIKLYEGRVSGEGIPQGLQDECQQWANRFPHLRILGTQLMCSNDEGFQWYDAALEKHSATNNPSAGKDRPANSKEQDEAKIELNVQGKKAPLLNSSSPELDEPTDSSIQDRPREIEAEGLFEEYLAFDSRDLDDEWQQECSGWGQKHRCLPPVSPFRCCHQAILDLLFDDVWRQLVGCMRELVQRQWESYNAQDEQHSRSLTPVQHDFQNPLMLPVVLPRLGQSKLPHLTGGPQSQNTKSRGSKHKSRRKSKKQKRPPAAVRVSGGASVAQNNLNDLIVIHSIPLQQRNLTVLERTQDSEDRMPPRPGSSMVLSSKPRPRRALEQSSSSLSRPPQSARRRNPPPRTLLPLVSSPNQASTPVSMDEVIRGTRLLTASDRLAPTSPLTHLSKNILLPPIGFRDPDASHAGHPSKSTQRQKGLSSRAHSVVNDEDGSSVPKDRYNIPDSFSRPNTTHTYRSDTPYRRSFTVLDSTGQGRPTRVSVGTDSLGIGVTGVSLGISSSSFLDSFSHHPLGHSPIEDEEEPGPQALIPAPLVPVSIPLRSYTRGGISSRSSRPGL